MLPNKFDAGCKLVTLGTGTIDTFTHSTDIPFMATRQLIQERESYDEYWGATLTKKTKDLLHTSHVYAEQTRGYAIYKFPFFPFLGDFKVDMNPYYAQPSGYNAQSYLLMNHQWRKSDHKSQTRRFEWNTARNHSLYQLAESRWARSAPNHTR